MPRRYVPKTYNNRRILRIILGTVITIALSTVILFLLLFFIFSRYVDSGQLIIPWLPEFQGPIVQGPSDYPIENEEIPDDNIPVRDHSDLDMPDLGMPDEEDLLPEDD